MFVTALIKLVFGSIMVVVTFGKSRIPDMLLQSLCFLLISFVYAGLMLALWHFFAPQGMICRNGAVYFDIPIILLLIFTILGYLIVRIIQLIADRRAVDVSFSSIMISYNNKTVVLKGIADTGNGVCDPFSGKPVIICSYKCIESILPDNIVSYCNGIIDENEGIRLAPCRTINGGVLLPVFTPDRIEIGDCAVNALVGVNKNEIGADCIFNPKLITLNGGRHEKISETDTV